MGKDFKKNKSNNSSKWLYKLIQKIDRSVVVTVLLNLVLFLLVCEAYDIAKEVFISCAIEGCQAVNDLNLYNRHIGKSIYNNIIDSDSQ